MNHDAHQHLIAIFATAAGAIMAVVTRAATSTPFIQSLIIAVVSGLLTGSALIFSAYLTRRQTDERVARLDESLDDVKGQLGVAKRRTDRIDQRDRGSARTERGGS